MSTEKYSIAKGFDRDVDYETMKKNIIDEYQKQYKKYIKTKGIRSAKTLVYLLILAIQLRNGSRITEAILAFREFINVGCQQIIQVKLCKSVSKKKAWVRSETNKNIKEFKDITTKPRYRKMMFPVSWFSKTPIIHKLLKSLDSKYHTFINNNNMKKNVLNYILRKFNSNTHSLRYAFINYMIFDQNHQLNDIAKFVGHKNMDQLVTYTQQKRCDKIFELDI